MKKFGLATQIFIALILGIVVGALVYGNETAIAYISPIGDIFIHLIKMIVMPIVIAALIVAVAGVGDIKKLGKLQIFDLYVFLYWQNQSPATDS